MVFFQPWWAFFAYKHMGPPKIFFVSMALRIEDVQITFVPTSNCTRYVTNKNIKNVTIQSLILEKISIEPFLQRSSKGQINQ